MNHEFAHLRQYIDACLKPHLAPNHLRPTLTIEAQKLLQLIDSFAAGLPDTSNPVYPPYIELPRPDMTKLSRKRAPSVLLEWSKQNQRHQAEYERGREVFMRGHVGRVRSYENAVFQRRVLDRLRRDVQNQTVNGIIVTTQRLNWVILKTGADGLSQIRGYCDELHIRKPNWEIEFSRIEYVYGLDPQATYCGVDEFDGYLVFYFDRRELAVLECPIVGNALYIIHGDWISLSRMPKTELLRHHSSRVSRITHTDHWRLQLKRHLTD